MTDQEKKNEKTATWVNCEYSLGLLLEYLDGTLPPEDQSALDRHFKACPPCIDFVRKYRTTPELCRKALASDPPDEVSRRLTSWLREKMAG